VESLEHHGHLQLEQGVRARVLTMSSATIDRLLAPVRQSSGGNGWRRPPRAHSGVRRRLQVRTFKGWDDHKQPGWLEIDLVAHCGGRLEGRFIWTLVATDIATGWSESLPVITRDGASVLAAIQRLRQQLPFPLRGIDADNDPAFMNALMEQWCDAPEQGIELTRSRAYQSNDKAWVEQKNGMLIRRVVGYERLVGLEAAQLLAELYAALRLYRLRGSLTATPTCSSHRSSSKAACGKGAGSSGSTTRREHRCSSSCVPECSAIRKPRASESSESGVTRWRCRPRCAAARAG